jgi:PIN domain nuclease of toxin-antitoxin system
VAAVIYLDTHVLVWLYALGGGSLSPAAAAALGSAQDIRISPMSRLELQYLYEVGRVTEPAAEVVDALHAALGVVICDAPFGAIAREAEALSWARDPFDRLIVAHAALHEAPLVTKDAVVHAHYPAALW